MHTLAFVYGPMTELIAPAYDRLPVKGLLVSFASITTAVTIQNLLLWFGGKFLLEKWRATQT